MRLTLPCTLLRYASLQSCSPPQHPCCLPAQDIKLESSRISQQTATHAHRSLHHVIPPQVDARANTPDTSDATTPPTFISPPTGDSLAHASSNVGGPEITPNRLCHILNGFTTAPHTISLQEFKPTTKHHIEEYERVAMFWKYHLFYSAPTTKNGVALLVHTSISPAPPTLTIHIPGTLISTQLQLHPNPLMPPLRIASYYGPHSIREKRECEPVLDSLLREACIILGDYNSITQHSHADTLTTNLSRGPLPRRGREPLATYSYPTPPPHHIHGSDVLRAPKAT